MNEFVKEVISDRISRTVKALEANNFEVYTVQSREAARETVEKLLPLGCTIGAGGSETLKECNIIELIRNTKYRFIDRYQKGLTSEQIRALYIEALGADVFVSGTNAITEAGELYNVDGNGNRIAALAFGPKSVIIVAGVNKIVKDIDEAARRVKSLAAPANTKRLGIKSYCESFGECKALANGQCGMTDGCASDNRICCDYLILARQRQKNRIKVILVEENLGF